jgi:WD40 repeat protein
MATAGSDGRAIVWDPFAGTYSTEPMPHPAPVDDVAFGVADGRQMLATACADGNTRLWDPIKASAARVAGSGMVGRTAFRETQDGLLLAGSGVDGQIFVWRASHGQPLRQLGPDEAADLAHVADHVSDLALGELGGKTVVAVATSKRAQAWDVRNGRSIAELALAGHQYDPVAVTVLHSAVLLAHLVDGEIEVRRLAGPASQFRLPPRPDDRNRALRLRFIHHPEIGTVLAVMDDQGVELVDAETGEQRWPRIATGYVSIGALGRIGGHDIFAFCSYDGVGLWSLTEEAPYGPGVHHAGSKSGLALVTVGGRDLVLTGHFATVRAWHARTGRLVSELPFGTSISSIAVAPAGDAGALVAVSGPGVVVVELHAAEAPRRQ